MTVRTSDNLLIVHWHDTGRWLGAYGHRGVDSPCVDRLAAEGIRFTRAHAASPGCSPARGAIFTGRYPHSNGLIGLAHHGFEYREGVRTLRRSSRTPAGTQRCSGCSTRRPTHRGSVSTSSMYPIPTANT